MLSRSNWQWLWESLLRNNNEWNPPKYKRANKQKQNQDVFYDCIQIVMIVLKLTDRKMMYMPNSRRSMMKPTWIHSDSCFSPSRCFTCRQMAWKSFPRRLSSFRAFSSSSGPFCCETLLSSVGREEIFISVIEDMRKEVMSTGPVYIDFLIFLAKWLACMFSHVEKSHPRSYYLVWQDFGWPCPLDLWAWDEAVPGGPGCEEQTLWPNEGLQSSERSHAAGWWWGCSPVD